MTIFARRSLSTAKQDVDSALVTRVQLYSKIASLHSAPFSPIQPDFVLQEQDAGDSDIDATGKVASLLWRKVLACVEVKCSSSEGPYRTLSGRVKSIVAQAGDYMRLHLAHRPFQLFSLCVLVWG